MGGIADNTVQNATDTIATDDVTTLNGNASSGVKVQRTKIQFGDDGTARDVSNAFPLPVLDPDAVASGTISATDAVVGAHGGAGVLLTGTPTANSYVPLLLNGGDSTVVFQLTGTFGGGTVWFECSANSTTGIDGSWTTLSVRTIGTTGTTLGDSTTVAGLFRGNSSGVSYLRVRVTGATTPSIAAVLRASAGDGPTALNAPLPSGPNTIGNVGIAPVARTIGTASGNIFRSRVNPSAVTGSTALVAAPGAGLSIHLTDVSVSNAGATINTVSFLDGATNVYDIVAAATGGGGSMNFQTPIKCTAATALNYTTSAASLTYITVTGYIA